MTLIYIKKLGFQIQKTNIRAQKTDDFNLAIYKIFIAKFQIRDKFDKA